MGQGVPDGGVACRRLTLRWLVPLIESSKCGNK